jgi:hypothetical protein
MTLIILRVQFIHFGSVARPFEASIRACAPRHCTGPRTLRPPPRALLRGLRKTEARGGGGEGPVAAACRQRYGCLSAALGQSFGLRGIEASRPGVSLRSTPRLLTVRPSVWKRRGNGVVHRGCGLAFLVPPIVPRSFAALSEWPCAPRSSCGGLCFSPRAHGLAPRTPQDRGTSESDVSPSLKTHSGRPACESPAEAERGGFEPPIGLPLYSISSAAPSATRTPLRCVRDPVYACGGGVSAPGGGGGGGGV